MAAGVGVAVVPALAVRPSPELAQLELHPPLPQSIIALAWQREELSPAVQRFIAVAREVAASFGPDSGSHAFKGTVA